MSRYSTLAEQIISFHFRYIDDQDRTNDAFDENGYYKTGDLVHLNDHGTYVIDGRASADWSLLHPFSLPAHTKM